MNKKHSILVNTWQTKSRPWIMKYDDTEIDLKKLIEKLEKLPPRVHTPKSFTEVSLPRYYLIVIENDEIIDIIGVTSYQGYTKWSYRNDYWHPWIIEKIVEALKKV